MSKAEDILRELKIDEEVLNIYPYGSQVYETANEYSDHDYIIVTKSAFLKSKDEDDAIGGFKNNAISNEDYTIQGVLYSRTGFIDAINNYDITALECLFLPNEMVIQKRWPFKIQRFDEKEMAKNIIKKISNSWHIADIQAKDNQKDRAKKGIFHSLRILHFALQLKEYQKIVNFQECNDLKKEINAFKDECFDTRYFLKERNRLMKKLRE